jgi:hypothetical protein
VLSQGPESLVQSIRTGGAEVAQWLPQSQLQWLECSLHLTEESETILLKGAVSPATLDIPFGEQRQPRRSSDQTA